MPVTVWSRLASILGRLPKWLAVSALIAVTLFLLFVAFKVYQFLRVFDDSLGVLSEQYGMNQWLARALAAGFFVPVAWGAKHALFGVWKSGIGKKLMTGGYTALYCVGMYLVSRNAAFSHSTGAALQWCATTPEGERCFDSPGYDPKYGLKLEAVTPEARMVRERRRLGAVPHAASISDIAKLQLFDPLTGAPRYWYYESADGAFELFDSPGFHPQTQTALQPVTVAVVRRIQEWQQRSHAAADKTSRDAFANRYVDRSARAGTSAQQWAVVITDSLEQTVSPLADAVADAIASRGMRAVHPFRPAFVQDKLNEQLFGGGPALVHKLSLGDVCAGVVVAKVSMTSSNSADVAGLVNTRLVAHVRLVAAGNGSILGDFEVHAQGAGFSREAAVTQALAHGAEALKNRVMDALGRAQ